MSGQAGSGCIFCRIVAGEVPSRQVASGELAYAFEDLHPVTPLHVLVVPRRHIDDAAHAGPGDGEVLTEMMALARQVAEDAGYGERGYRLVLNTGPDAGMEVKHLHMHVLAGRELGWPPG